ncbi:hypothetical protein TraAM80_06882 [Trypanosoma rangeli]|uniref:MSP domain-containing protein n=1 Tax=Trypanosoma rangeli TaxID=5698 RepID=A0A422N827_TRYRA|nr:uncharacterized protein TraAM80_06882 [Trypanosoma rangeli]RNF01582.1 hypothetical protein TraAM80_06882 [Trypanosoma rangeli]|eukprot:RNF01582.1 hypothetical protein TraAM80_06882 [Trypanosoma rangeli]
MAIVPGPLVQLSQDSLYFPLPLKDIIIENIVQVKNLLERTENKAENVIAFKVLATVRCRYNVRPSTGLIFPTESVKIRFLLNVPHLRQQANEQGTEAAVILPDANTKDDLLVDIAVLPKDQAKTYIENINEGKNGEKTEGGTAGMYSEQAAAFWKMLGSSKPKGLRAECRKLSCVYGEAAIPETLVMRLSGDKPKSAVPPQPLTPSKNDAVFALPSSMVPKTRPNTNNTDTTRKSPPRALPRSLLSASVRNRDRPSPYAGSLGGLPSPKPLPPLERLSGVNNNVAGIKDPSLRSAAAALHFKPGLARQQRPLWKECLLFRVSSQVLAALLILSFLCALFESGTFLSWLLIGQ